MRITFNVLVLLLWGWLFRPIYPYLATIFTREEFRTNQVILVGAIILIILQVRKGSLRPRLDVLPQLNLPALGMILAGAVIFLLSERFLNVNTLSASMFGLASYGLLGLWMRPDRWRRNMPAALLLIGALPFGEHLQTFVGYPVRVLTAAVVRDGLAAVGIHSIGMDTILVFESGISQVDIPCSGVKSLWTGGLFLLAATWIEERPINLRWLLIAMGMVALLLAANLGRVALLILIGQVAGWRLLAEMLHVPLGVLGFAGACAAVLGLLRWNAPAIGEQYPVAEKDAHELARPVWLAPLLAALVLLLALLYVPRPQTVSAQAAPVWQFPAGLALEAWPLTPQELGWLTSTGANAAERWRFHWRDLSGSMLLVTSATWRGHHHPERCFEVYGLKVENSFSHVVSPNFAVRLVLLSADQKRSSDAASKDSQGELLSAVYWLQSAQLATDDYAVRMWADLSPERQPWVMVTLLFDSAMDPRSIDALDLYSVLSQAVQDNLGGGMQP